jgi:hypothetical protein
VKRNSVYASSSVYPVYCVTVTTAAITFITTSTIFAMS